MEGYLLKRPHPETHSPPGPVSNKRCRNVMVDLSRNCPFGDDDSVFREFLREQRLPLYPDIIYLSDDDEDEAPEEEEEEDRWTILKPRLDLPSIVDQDSVPYSRPIGSVKDEDVFGGRVFDGGVSVSREYLDQESQLTYSDITDLLDEDMTEYQDVQRWMSRLDRLFAKGQDSTPSSRRTSFSETSPLLVDADCRLWEARADRLMRPALIPTDHCSPGQYHLLEHSICCKPSLGLAADMGKHWRDLHPLFEDFGSRKVLARNIASKDVFDHGLQVRTPEALAELPQFNFLNGGGPRFFQGGSDDL
ncbi:hypothetical protein CDL15_Pgr010816 [Punica granatum]|uniref:Uncharacterized protein n=1 Tax=Punica granatum TaxID=22663 RepID=A0A218W5W1_PUNGR|nr:hypothetical protein CDL15_Pgr010816 [Punica granatum]PKI33578.1 hypothetical protein CRG98_046034 [Punica granatum]